MGNCFKSLNNEDVSLIRQSEHQGRPQEQATISESPSYRRTQPEHQHTEPAYHPSPGVNRLADQSSDEEQVKIAQRLGLISHLPTGKYDGMNKKVKECVICMNEFTFGEHLRYLPCMHTYHKDCIDDWLMRSFTCPSCMEPVDAALLLSY